MTDDERRTIADDERSPAADAADEVPFAPPAVDPESEKRPEPPGTAEAVNPKTGPDDEPVVPPSRSHH